MLVSDLCVAMDRLAPERFAEGWDNVGLLLGDREARVAPCVLLTIDLTDAVVVEAIERGAGAVIAYHPPIFTSVKRLTERSREGRAVLSLARAGAAVYSPHTAIDAAPGGVADWLLEAACGCRERPGTRRPMTPRTETEPTQRFKLVTFVPSEHVERVAAALATAGAGVIGGYTNCTFRADGTGTFLGGGATSPAVGSRGVLESVSEIRLEMVCPGARLTAVIESLRASHPYEEPAFDILSREPTPTPGVGSGRVCDLIQPVDAEVLTDELRGRLGVPSVRLAVPRGGGQIARVAVCPGAGGSALAGSGLLRDGTGLLFITGEMSHHDVLAALSAGCSIALAGHTNTERGYLPTLAERLRADLEGMGVTAEALISDRDRWPFAERSGER